MIQYNTHLCYVNMALCDKNQVKLKTITVQSHPPPPQKKSSKPPIFHNFTACDVCAAVRPTRKVSDFSYVWK